MPAAIGLAALLWLGQQTQPDPQASVLRGTILDAATTAPIGDVRVSLTDVGKSTRTTADGRFEFRDLTPGKYTLTVSTIGYIFVRRRIDVPFNTVVEISVPLAEGTGTYQETVTVTSDTRSPPEIGVASQSQLGSAGLQDLRGVAADDPMRAMQALPGVATGDDFQSQFSVRGASFRHVGIVTDDMVTPLLLHQVRGAGDTGSIAMINTDVISRASLLSGPHPLRHGDWIGATMEFDLREGSRDRAALRAAVSGTSASTVIEGPIGPAKRGSWLVSMRKSYIDWLIRKLEPTIDSTIGFSDMQSKAVYDLTSRQQLQLVLVGGVANYQQVQASVTNGLKDARSRSALGSLAWRYTRTSLVVTQRVSVITSDFRDHGQRGQELGRGLTHSVAWRGDLLKPIGKTWTVEGGARAESEQTSQTLRTFRLVSNALQVLNVQSVGAGNTTASGWGQIARRTTSSGLAAGVRASTASIGDWTAVSPWVLGERSFGAFTLRAGAGAASQFPDVVLFEANARGSMAPEHVVSFDAGLEHHLTKTMRWLVTGFRREDSHVIRLIGEDRLVNGARVAATPFPAFGGELDGTARGVDLLLERRAPTGLSGWAGYTWAHTRYHDTITGETFDGDFDQRHTLNLFVQQRLSYRWAASLKLRVGSNFPLVGYFAGAPTALTLGAQRNQVRLPVYARLDLRANRTFTFNQRRLTLFVEVMNVTGRRNLGQAAGTISSGNVANGFAARLIPRVPSAGFLIEF
jgi:5-hydroxyisourate hydrolase-like protein (transthyretin family)